MQVITIGPFMMKWQIVMLIIAAAAGYMAVSLFLRKTESEWRRNVLDQLLSMLIIGFLTWKFSPLIFDFKAVIRSPMSLLYYSGGTGGIALGILFALVFLVYKTIKQRRALGYYAHPVLIFTIAAEGMYAILRVISGYSGAAWLVETVIALVLLLTEFKRKEKAASLHQVVVTLLWFSLGLFAVSLLVVQPSLGWLGFSVRQFVLISLSIASLFMKIFLEIRNRAKDDNKI